MTTAEREAQTARQTAQEATQRLQNTETALVTSQLDTVLSGISAATSEAEAAEREYVAAAESGDFAAQARAQRKMSGAEARIQRLTEAKDDLEDAAKRRPAPGARTDQRPPQRDADPVEQFAKSMSPRSAAWIRSHPECVTDPKLNARMLAAHNLAVADDVALDSDDYFRRIEEGIAPGTKKAAPAPAGGDGRRPSSAAAPASGAGGALNGGSIDVGLTKREALAATDGTVVWNWDSPDGKYKKGDPVGLAEYARRKYYGKKAGLYDKSYTEE